MLPFVCSHLIALARVVLVAVACARCFLFFLVRDNLCTYIFSLQ